MPPNFGTAILLSALAGLATTFGSIIGLFVKRPGPRFMALSLGFSAGVMILVSFVELFNKGVELLGGGQPKAGLGLGLIGFFAGFIVIYLIDVFTPHTFIEEECDDDGKNLNERSRLMRLSLMVAVGIGIHNFPEGMATFVGTLSDPSVGLAIAVAIAIHNVPEGIAVSVPVYAATGSRRKAFLWSFLSGVSEPVGAGLVGLVLLPFINDAVLGMTLSSVAGLMVFIALDELLPVAHSYGREHFAILGLAGGMAVMALSLYLLR